ncbi:MAG: hypothetical protein JSR80_07825, partial [Verrucomicrobia bacterium]|nr:hypothetical protein [Verrucomicrobiota bacterium]
PESAKSTTLLQQVTYADGWVVNIGSTLMFFQDWTPLKFGAFAPLIEKICNASWVSLHALTTLKHVGEDQDPFTKIDIYKALGDLSFATTSVWFPGTPLGIAGIASGAIGLRVLLSQKL